MFVHYCELPSTSSPDHSKSAGVLGAVKAKAFR
jgi:hypothetical protein